MKKLLTSKIKAGNEAKAVREVVKTYKAQKQDMYDDTKEILKPSIEAQKEVKKTIDEKQNRLIKKLQENKETVDRKQDEVIQQLKENQVELTKSIDVLSEIMSNQGSTFGVEQWINDSPSDFDPLDIIEEESEDEGEKIYREKPKSLFNPGDEEIIKKYGFDPTLENIPDNNEIISKIKSTTGKMNSKNPITKQIAQKEKDVLKNYHQSVKIVKSHKDKKSPKTTKTPKKSKAKEITESVLSANFPVMEEIEASINKKGKGIRRYNQPKRNAYKISQKGQYGGLVIDLPKLHGHLKVVAHKNGQKVHDKQADFDTLNLLTKRFNSRKNYSELARTVFNDLNRLSEIPIHRTSKKYSKLGNGVVYYNNPQDLLSRLELLGGSMSAGNNSSDVREVFANIVHKLNKLNVIDNKQMNDLIKEYLIY